MLEQPASSPTSHVSPGPRVARLAIVSVVAIILGLVLFKTITVAWSGWRAYQTASELMILARIEPQLQQLPAIQEELATLAADLTGLQNEIDPLAPVLAWMQPLPEYGPAMATSPELLAAGRKGLAVTQQALDLVAPSVARIQREEPDATTMDVLLLSLAENAARLPELVPGLASLRATLATVPAAGLPERLASPLAAAPHAVELGEVFARLGPHLPGLLGMDAPKTYLILVQNNHELRATGGFIAAVGRLTLDEGRITDLDFVDSYDIYRRDGVYPPAPAPMQKYMNIQLLVMRDANWSPDLPTSAQIAQSLYQSDTGIKVDGIVTIDLHAVKRIFSALGTLRAPGFDEPVTGDNIETQIISLWERPAGTDATADSELGEWWNKRKDFIPALAGAVMEQVQQGKVNYLALAAALQETLYTRSVQVWVDDADVQRELHEIGWDGALQAEKNADFLAVVDTNMGYNKVDAAIERQLDYRVVWPDGPTKPAQATVTLTYTHPIDAEDPGCDLTPRYGKDYADLIARCYFNYVRVYVPGSSRLLNVEGVSPETVETQRGETGTQVFTGYFILEPNHRHQISYTYLLPEGITPTQYRLILQRQSGTNPLPLRVNIDGDTYETQLEAGLFKWPVADAGPVGAR